MASEALPSEIHNHDPFKRRIALEVLGKGAESDAARAHVVFALSDPSGYVVRTACEISAAWTLIEARPILLKLLADADPLTRGASLRALQKVGIPSDFNLVFPLYESDSSAEVQRAAAWTLRELVSAETWKKAVDRLVADAIPRHRIWGCELTAQFGSDDQRATLEPLLADSDGHVRKAAANALAKIA